LKRKKSLAQDGCATDDNSSSLKHTALVLKTFGARQAHIYAFVTRASLAHAAMLLTAAALHVQIKALHKTVTLVVTQAVKCKLHLQARQAHERNAPWLLRLPPYA
jgi:hypothetical protein